MLDKQQQTSEPPSSTGLTVNLEVAEPVVVGLSVLATIYIINRGKEPMTVSSRLNLMEGDIQFLVTDPGGSRQKVTGAGGQPDTALRRVTLAPGQQIAASINLLNTSVGETFNQLGTYNLQAIYFPSPVIEPVSSNSISLSVRIPQTESEKQTATILQSNAAKCAITLSEDTAASEIHDLATRFGDTIDGKLASLLVIENQISSADSTEEIKAFLSAEPITTAFFITALSNPFSNVGNRLKEAFAAFLISRQSDKSAAADDDSELSAKALKIVSGQPFEQ